MLDRSEAEKLFEQNMGLVPATISRCFPPMEGDEDMLQVGYIGLWRACTHYQPEKSKFVTFAITCIKNALKHELVYKSWPKRAGETISFDDIINDKGDLVISRKGIDWLDVDGILEELCERDRRILSMRLRDMEYRDIGKQIGISRTMVGNRIKVIRQVIKKHTEKR